MRCPKCQYIGFDSGDRCRNCGYEFAMAATPSGGDELPLRTGEVIGPPDDLVLRGSATPPSAGTQPRQSRGAGGALGELPLFVNGQSDRAAPLERDDTPRPPLWGRRSPHEVQRRRPLGSGGGGDADLGAFVPEQDFAPGAMSRAAATPDGRNAANAHAAPDPAPLLRRGIAAAVDLGILAAIDLTVLYFTLRLTGLQFASAARLPLLPLLGFLALLDGGYLVGFTAASGQTIGKMLARVRVVGEGTRRVALGSAVVRAVAYGFSVLPLGLGCLPVLFSPDRRAIHDRLAGTRVVVA